MGNTINSKYWRALKPDAQAFDEIRLVTKPRYKTSGLSGDEWRISIDAEFYRKGKLIHTEWVGHDMEGASKNLGWKFGEVCDLGKAMFGGEDDICDQEGCSEKATTVYKLKERVCKYCAEKNSHYEEDRQKWIRLFCDKHKTRGDSSLEDQDTNYENITEEYFNNIS